MPNLYMIERDGYVYNVVGEDNEFPDSCYCHSIKPCDEIYVSNYGENLFLGAKYKNYNAIVTKVHYKSKKWWQFWKKREIIGYNVRFFAERKS